MALYLRLCSRPLGRTPEQHLFALTTRNVTLKSIPPQSLTENHDERNAALKRPLSPHLTIYQPQLTSLLSLTHRTTGIILCGVTVLGGIGGVFYSTPFEQTMQALEATSFCGPVVFLGKLALAVPFAFHFCNGMRHLLWDTGRPTRNEDEETKNDR